MTAVAPGTQQAADPLRQAAFGATPGAAVFAVANAAWAEPRDRWLAAVVLGGQGRYAAAAAVLGSLLAHPDALWASLAASTLASHRRQLGAHAAARPLDALALRRVAEADGADVPEADGMDLAGARCDALVGLAADALGLSRLAVAGRLLAAAERADPGGWRTAVRLAWVRAELALASGQAAAAVGPARHALQCSAGAARHEAKSRLVLAVALATTGETGQADRQLHELAASVGNVLLPLRWATELVLADLHSGTEHGEAHRRAALAALRLALSRADVRLRTAARSSLWVPSGVLQPGDSAERSSAGETHDEICTGLCQVSAPRDR